MDVRKTQKLNGVNAYCDLLEKVATGEHEQWSHWTKHFLDNLTPENIERWRKQIQTPYSELSKKEQESDIVWARKVLDLCFQHEMKLKEQAFKSKCWRDLKKDCELSKCCYDASCQAVFDYWKFANTPTWRDMVAAELIKEVLKEKEADELGKRASEKSAYQQIDDLFYSQGLKGKLEFTQLLEKIKEILGEGV